MSKTPTLALLLIAIGLGSLVVGLTYTAYGARSYSTWVWQNQQGITRPWYSQSQLPANTAITLDQAKTIAQQYLASTGNQNLAIKEIMEFQYNFYVAYYEKDTGIGAFEMLIWKLIPPYRYGMMGWRWGWLVAAGSIVPEPGPNMMWNTKYSPMANGIMGYWYLASSTITVSESQAEQYAQAYLDVNFQNAKVEMTTQFYGYYTIDFTVNGQIAGMLSVNGYTGQVWLHTWHGAFIQEVEFD
jgi:hypothetical protein